MSREALPMDGVHDLGGMQGFGRVEREEHEPVFHAPWEAAVLAMMRAGGARGVYNIDEFRHAIERMNPADYLSATYYEKWLDGIARLFTEKSVVTEAEMEARTAFFGARPDAAPTAALTGPLPERVPFNLGWVQEVVRETGAQPLYSVRFEARELWGLDAEPNQWVHLDLWERYLESGR